LMHRLDLHYNPTNVTINFDATNAFNTVSREHILKEVSTHFPEILPLVANTLTRESRL